MKYFLDIYDTALNNYYDFALVSTEDHQDIVYEGRFSDLGIDDNDDQFADKLDAFFLEALGIKPEDWEIG